jgi:hypothetical protein
MKQGATLFLGNKQHDLEIPDQKHNHRVHLHLICYLFSEEETMEKVLGSGAF